MDGVENVHLVAPLVESGLHCGRVRGIKALTMRSRRPARRERAPLRLQRRPRRDLLDARSPRSSRAGSIAASRWARADHPGPAVAPLVESGLHCGGTQTEPHYRVELVAPLVESGLHCGCAPPYRTRRGGSPSPRSSRAGSIAAIVSGRLVALAS